MFLVSVIVEQSIVVPAWLLSLIVSLLISFITAWGIITGAKSNLEVRAKRNEEDIKSLQNEKVNKSEFQMLYNELLEIKNMLMHKDNNEK